METIKVLPLAEIDMPEKYENGDFIDLRCAEDTWMAHGEYKIISLGFAAELPSGYEALVVPRSSTFSKYGIIMANSIGIIDESYCGKNDIWRFPALCLAKYSPCTEVERSLELPTDKTFIPKGARIAQFRILYHMQELEIKVVDHLEGKSRGGFGSSGSM